MVVAGSLRVTINPLQKTMSSSYHMEQKAFIKATCSKSKRIGNFFFFLLLLLLKVCESFYFRQVKRLVACSVCMSLIWIFREDRTK